MSESIDVLKQRYNEAKRDDRDRGEKLRQFIAILEELGGRPDMPWEAIEAGQIALEGELGSIERKLAEASEALRLAEERADPSFSDDISYP